MSVRWVSGILAGAFVALFGVGADAAEVQKPKPKPVKSAPQTAPECGWIGKRIIQLLSRDDVVAAGEFRQFYVSFGCSEAHLGAAFGCAVEGATGADSCAARADCVDLCWRTPTASTLDKAPPPAPASMEKSGNSASGKAKAAQPAAAPASTAPTPVAAPQGAKKPTETKPSVLPSGPYDKKQ